MRGITIERMLGLTSRLLAFLLNYYLPIGNVARLKYSILTQGTIDEFVGVHSEAIRKANAAAGQGILPPFDEFQPTNDDTAQMVQNGAYRTCKWYGPNDRFTIDHSRIEFDNNNPNQFYIKVFCRYDRFVKPTFDETWMEAHIHVIVHEENQKVPNAVSYVVTQVYPAKVGSEHRCKVHACERAVAFGRTEQGKVVLRKATCKTVARPTTDAGCVTRAMEAAQTDGDLQDLQCVKVAGKLLQMVFEVCLIEVGQMLEILDPIAVNTVAQAQAFFKTTRHPAH